MSFLPRLIISLALAVIVFALLVFAFGYGFAVNKYRLFPFELDEQREIVWGFVNLLDDGRVGIVEEVQRLPDNAADIIAGAVCLQ